MTTVVVKLPTKPWTHACDRFVLGRSFKFCAACGFAKVCHPRLVHCNSCGETFIAATGETNGMAMCDEHKGRIAL